DLRAPLSRQVRLDERGAKADLVLERAREAEQLVLDLIERAFGLGDVEPGFRVALDARVLRAHRLCLPARGARQVLDRLVDQLPSGLVVAEVLFDDARGQFDRQLAERGLELLDRAVALAGNIGL